MERNFNKLPTEWVDRIFERLACLYNDRSTNQLPNEGRKDLYKVIWSTGLAGLSVSEIRKAFSMCEAYPYAAIPNHIEFYHYAKGIRAPTKTGRLEKNEPMAGNPEVSKAIFG